MWGERPGSTVEEAAMWDQVGKRGSAQGEVVQQDCVHSHPCLWLPQLGGLILWAILIIQDLGLNVIS